VQAARTPTGQLCSSTRDSRSSAPGEPAIWYATPVLDNDALAVSPGIFIDLTSSQAYFGLRGSPLAWRAHTALLTGRTFAEPTDGALTRDRTHWPKFDRLTLPLVSTWKALPPLHAAAVRARSSPFDVEHRNLVHADELWFVSQWTTHVKGVALFAGNSQQLEKHVPSRRLSGGERSRLPDHWSLGARQWSKRKTLPLGSPGS
jgi:hypothetical protein